MSRASAIRATAFAAAGLLISSLLLAGNADAQGAWVDPAGSLSGSLDYVMGPSNAIVETPDLEFEDEPIISHTISLGAEYTPIEDLAVEASLPLVLVKYQGDGESFPPHGNYDDGDYHKTLQDFRLGARYQLLREIVAFSPHIAGSIPVRDYENQGYASAGRRLKQLHLGASVGRTLDPILPNLFVHATYEFSLVEKLDATPETEEVGQNRSDLAFLLGYFFLDGDLSLDVGANWRIAHGGIEFTEYGDYAQSVQDYHDALLREEFILVGGDVGYKITDRFSVDATARFFVRGYNTRDSNIFGLGLTFAVL
jgi:hypothetical protein